LPGKRKKRRNRRHLIYCKFVNALTLIRLKPQELEKKQSADATKLPDAEQLS
jgi:hypothetical protein